MAVVLSSLLLLLLAAPAAAPTAGSAGYEQQLIDWGVATQGRVVEPSPEGQVIDEVLVSSEKVFSPTDPWPSLLNIFHVRSQEDIVRREVLLQPGQRWDLERVAEMERNLRRLAIFAVARVVALKGPPGHVALLVVTKDRWSLRLNSEFTLIGNLLQYLRLQPTEMNFLGRNLQLSLDFILRLDTVSLGEYFLEPRLGGTRNRLAETAAIILNRQTGTPEGTSGYVLVDRPFYSLDQRYSFSAWVDWNVRRRRVFRGASVWQLDAPGPTGATSAVPFIYDFRDLESEGTVTRRWGTTWLLDVSAGVFGYDIAAAAPAESHLSVDQSQWLTANYLPHTESAVGLVARSRLFESRFVVLKNVDTLELSEDYQLGGLLQLGARWGLPVGFTSARYFEAALGVRYRWLWGGDLLTVQAAVASRFITGGEPLNRRYTFEVVNASPPFEGGRFVFRVVGDIRQNDVNHPQTLLGGSTGLRGAAPELLSGRNYLLGNFEYRTRAFELRTLYVGVVLFYDVGSAFDDVPTLTHTAGLGLRILLPQFNQEVIRIDFGVVLGGEAPSLARLNATYGQVTDLRPGTFLDSPL